MPAALLRLLPLLLGLGAFTKAPQALRALAGTGVAGKIPGLSGLLGGAAKRPLLSGLGASLGVEHLSSSLLGLGGEDPNRINSQIEGNSTNDAQLTQLLSHQQPQITQNELALEDLQGALRQMGVF